MELERIKSLIGHSLHNAFPGEGGKQKIFQAGNRLNFSCPYCGDSDDARKKRGNFYTNTFAYKCYNGGCGVFKDGYAFFRDFGVASDLTQDEKKDILDIIKENKEKRKTLYGSFDFSLLFNLDFKKYVVSRKELMRRLSLVEVEGSQIEAYLRRRNQPTDHRFAWDPKQERLFLFNLTNHDEVVGLQLRNMSLEKGGSKYYTYKLSGIWEKLLGVRDVEFLKQCTKIDPVSHVFNLFQVSFDRTITIFEGPMDAWLWKNSVALCSVENKFPFEFDDIQYWYDWDEAGRRKTSELLTQGRSVFNWKKFLEENSIPENRKWDLNDLVNYLREKSIKIKRFDGYFTSEVLDLASFVTT